jgi:hypothetical protein
MREMKNQKINHYSKHKLLQENSLPGIWVFYRSHLENWDTTNQLLWALCDGELLVVDAYIPKDQKPNEENYSVIGEGKYIGSQHAIHRWPDKKLEIFLKAHPECRKRILGKK